MADVEHIREAVRLDHGRVAVDTTVTLPPRQETPPVWLVEHPTLGPIGTVVQTPPSGQRSWPTFQAWDRAPVGVAWAGRKRAVAQLVAHAEHRHRVAQELARQAWG